MKSYICNSNCDTHMMKNMEWGAVAYLSRSQYGINDEVIKNNQSYTGGGQNEKAFALVDNLTQSTIGNVYGIYDMNGCNYEYVMANFLTCIEGNDYSRTVGSSGFNNLDEIESKYIDEYKEYDKDIYGDAIYETSSSGSGKTSWHGANSTFITSNIPWLIRGGRAGLSRAGVFSFTYGGGDSDNGHSFYPVALIF